MNHIASLKNSKAYMNMNVSKYKLAMQIPISHHTVKQTLNVQSKTKGLSTNS